MKVASVSLCERVIKGVSWASSFTQGPRGCWGSSGSRGSKTSEREGERETEEEKQRWAEIGLHRRRADGRRICEENKAGKKKKKKRTKHKGFSLGCDRIPKVRVVENEEADDRGLEVRTPADSSERRP